MAINDPSNDSLQYNKNEEPIVISKPTSDRLLKLDRPSDAMALYWFYYYHAKWQHTNQPYANNRYTANGLKWTNDRLMRAKKDLIKLSLIEQLPRQWNQLTKKIGYPRIKINFVWWDKNHIKTYRQEALLPTKSNSVGKEGIKGNTLRLKGNTSSIKGKKDFLTAKESFDPEDLPTHLGKHPKVVRAWAEFVQHRKEKGCRLTPLAYKKLVKAMVTHSTEEIVDAIDKAISSGWRGLFFNDNQQPINNASPLRKEQIGQGLSEDDSERFSLRPCPSAEAARRLYKLVARYLGQATADAETTKLNDHIRQVKEFHQKVWAAAKAYTAIRHEDNRRRNSPGTYWSVILNTMSLNVFFLKWLQFLKDKQSTFPLRSVRDLQMDKTRWCEFVGQREQETGYNLLTGKPLPEEDDF